MLDYFANRSQKSQKVTRAGRQTLLLVIAIVALVSSTLVLAQNSRERLDGVTNFGRLTDKVFTGGQVTAQRIENLAGMGVKTIIDLRDEESPGEARACAKNGIKYLKFPMNGHAAPEEQLVGKVLSVLKRAKEPVYFHCSAGRHRAGTIAALYRIRIQGWSPDRAWAEQKSYGFGPVEGHPALYQ